MVHSYNLLNQFIDISDLTPEEIKTHKPTIVQVGENNTIVRQ